MLKFYPSNRTENLAFIISEIMRREPLKNIFEQEKIVVQSYGMGTWLQQQISTELGIAAMIDCCMPASFIWSLAEAVLPEYLKVQNFEKQNLRWQIFESLPEKMSLEKYRQLAAYLEYRTNDDQSYSEQVLFELASAVADVFDGYQNYRPDWLQAWEQGKSIQDMQGITQQTGRFSSQILEIEAWQADLWCSVFPNIQLAERRHRSSLISQLEQALKSLPKGVKTGLPERIFLFGLSALPPRMLAVIKALAEHIDVHVVVNNPCRYYWGDVRSEYQELLLSQSLLARGVSPETIADNFIENNTLLASWGKVGRDYMSLLMEEEIFSDLSVHLYDDLEDGCSSSLSRIQSDILNLRNQNHIATRSDQTIRFASCHSPLREVEALHDYLLNVLDEHSSITLRDVIVMVPNIDDYAAYIDAVFSKPAYDRHGQAHLLSYSIADQALNIHQPLLECIGNFLTLDSSRLTGTVLLDWLDFPAIRQRFDIDDVELEQIHHWVSSLNVRWGLSEEHRDSTLGVSNSGEANTWLAALKRLIGGYVVGAVSKTLFAGEEIIPEEIFGSDQQILAGKFARLIDTMDQTISIQKGNKLPNDALAAIAQIWDLWLDHEALAESVSQAMTKSLDSVSEEFRISGFQQVLPFSIVAQQVRAVLEEEKTSQRFLSGRINFCTLMPMRSVPFSVVCLLGMNEGKYPRPENKPSFDLLARTPSRVGDRSRRDDDRYLFLEALLSARDHLYISYTGRNIIDNSERYPSVLVGELQDYCRQHFTLENEQENDIVDFWTHHHHLQAFNTNYYRDDGTGALGKSYNMDWLSLLTPSKKEAREVEINDAEELNHQLDMFAESSDDLVQDAQVEITTDVQTLLLDDLAETLASPLKFYYQKILGLKTGAIPDELDESEPFALDGLDSFKLKGDILLSAAYQDDVVFSTTAFDTWRLSGLLPRAPMDEVYYSQTEEQLGALMDYFCSTKNGQRESLPIDLIISNKRIIGSLVLLDGCIFEFSLSKNPSNALFSTWVKHVVANYLLHNDHETRFSGESMLINAEQVSIFPALSEEDASLYLDEILQMYRDAEKRAIPFLPKTAYAWIFESESKAANAFRGNQQRSGEMDSAYWQRYCQYSGQVASNVMPDFESMVLVRQVLKYKDRFSYTDLQGESLK
jgi:exodeoxyribonuclease V gamma subunit